MEQQLPRFIKSKKFPDHVCKTQEATLWIQAAPWTWYGHIARNLLLCDLFYSNFDASIVVKKYMDMHMQYFCLYIDYMTITRNFFEEVAKLR